MSILSGLRVVEAASMIMVPSVGAALADYGAEVVKLEPLEGDLNRRGHRIPGMPVHDYEYCYLPDNRGKRCLAIDLKAPGARDIVRGLVAQADVFLTNHRPKSLAALGLALRLEVAPVIVYRWIAKVEEPSEDERRRLEGLLCL